MYKVRDNTISNRTVTMADGGSVTFVDHFASVPDKYVEYFRRISDFQVQTHTDDTGVETPVVEEPVVETETPAEAVEETSEVAAEESAQPDAAVAEETPVTEEVVAEQPAVEEKAAEEVTDARPDFQKAETE